MNKQTRTRLAGWKTAVGLAFLLILVAVSTAMAHTRVEIGPYAVVVGWLVEPPIVGERNALVLEITEDEEPVTGAEGTLDVELVYGAQTLRANLNPSETPGLYTVDIFPTVRGQYAVRLFGTLGEETVNEVLEPEEVFPASRLQFPEPVPDGRDLEKEIATLESDLQTARTIGYVGIGMALFALIVALVAIMRKRA